VWCADTIAETHGFLALGTPIGSPACAQAQLNLHLAAQQILLDELPQLADLQASWLLLTYCADPRAQHILRTVPPTLAGEYAARHDAAVVATLSALLVPARSSRSRRHAGRGRVRPPPCLGAPHRPSQPAGSGRSGASTAAACLAARGISRCFHFLPRGPRAAPLATQPTVTAPLPIRPRGRGVAYRRPDRPRPHFAAACHELPLPLTAASCGSQPGLPGCGGRLDQWGDHALACPRSGAFARRARIRVAREAVGADGRVVPQQWLAATTAPGVSSHDRRCLDLVIHSATALGEALCCDATLVSP